MSLNSSELQAATRVVEEAKRILIVPHANADPDALGSALACYAVFSSLGKECTVVCADTLSESLAFLPGTSHLTKAVSAEHQFVVTLDCSSGLEIDKLRYTIEDNKVNIIIVPKKGKVSKERFSFFDEGSSYDLIVVVDSAELPLLGSVYTENVDLFTTTPILNVDHHVSNSRFGQTQLVDSVSASATEVLYFWFSSNEAWKKAMTPDVATLLLTGLITDTRSFQNPNTTPRSLEVAANLLDLGARQQEIIQHIYKTKPLSTLRLWGRALHRIQADPDARIVWSWVSREDLLELSATSKETQGLLDELISTIPDADVHALFTETEEGGLKASLRSSSLIDVNTAAGKLFQGGGHARASGFKIKQYSNYQLAVLDCIAKLKEEIRHQRSAADTVEPIPAPINVPPQPVIQSAPATPVSASSAPADRIDVLGTLGASPKQP